MRRGSAPGSDLRWGRVVVALTKISRTGVLEFVKKEFDEGDEATDRIRRRPFGWQIDTQPRAYLDSLDPNLMSLGDGPLLVDSHTGEVWAVSSSPSDVFGDTTTNTIGWSQLRTRALFEAWRSAQCGAPQFVV